MLEQEVARLKERKVTALANIITWDNATSAFIDCITKVTDIVMTLEMIWMQPTVEQRQFVEEMLNRRSENHIYSPAGIGDVILNQFEMMTAKAQQLEAEQLRLENEVTKLEDISRRINSYHAAIANLFTKTFTPLS